MNEEFDEAYRCSSSLYGTAPSSHLARYLEKYNVRSPGECLDIGCGEGRNAIFLASMGFSVLAIDSSPTAIERLKKSSSEMGLNIKCEVADIRTIDLQKTAYALVVANTILDHLERQEGDHLILQLIDALCINGCLFASVFTTEDPGFTFIGGKSETAKYVKRYFGHQELSVLCKRLTLLSYAEECSLDQSHGQPHYHSMARIFARRDVVLNCN